MERMVKQILKSRLTLEGAGVRLRRVFGYSEVPLLARALAKAFQELEEGTFIKAGRAVEPSRAFYRS